MQKTVSSKLADTLISKKLLTKQQLNKLLKTQAESGRTLLEVLNELGFVPMDNLLEVVSSELHTAPIRLSRLKISMDVVNLIPRKLVDTYQVMPISKIGDTLTVAMTDPMNIIAIDDIKRVTNLQVIPILSSRSDILDAVEVYYTEDASEALKDVVKDMESAEITLVDSKEETSDTDVSELLHLTKEEPVVRLTDHILVEGVRRRASDIFVEPQEKDLMIRYRVDGMLQEGPRPPKSMHQGIVCRIKIMSNLNIAERRLPQDGRCKLNIQNRAIDFRISTVPTYLGEKVCLRILDPMQAKLDLAKLGFDEASQKILMKAASNPHGMILACGPTGSGKTTTLYSLLTYLNSIEKNLVTIEDPIEFAIQGINQVNTRADVGLTFATALRSILRQDPDVVLVGEIRDNETADIAVKAALTGHLVLSTLHTNTAVGCIIRLTNMGLEPFLLASSLVMAASQRLVRKVCKECCEEYEASSELKKTLGIKDTGKITFCRPMGCDRCSQSGYSGRVCIIETLVISPKIRELIMKRASEDQLKIAARKDGTQTLRENAVAKAKQGITRAEEVLRLTMPDEEIKS